jgi:hypothetical protein
VSTQTDITPGMFVRKMFDGLDGSETMWVRVAEVRADRIIGELDNNPLFSHEPDLQAGDIVEVRNPDIIGVMQV